MAKAKDFDGGVWFFKATRSQVWHVMKVGNEFVSICGKDRGDAGGCAGFMVPDGERICSKCLHKLEKALGEAHRIVNVGD